jgi:hypothetical protein
MLFSLEVGPREVVKSRGDVEMDSTGGFPRGGRESASVMPSDAVMQQEALSRSSADAGNLLLDFSTLGMVEDTFLSFTNYPSQLF